MKKLSLLTLGLLASFMVVAMFVRPSTSTLGVDMSSEICAYMSQSDWDCFVQNGYSFAIIETWQGGYGFDSSIANCVNQAWAAGMAHVDVYAFMCPNCNYNYPASSAVSSIISNLQNAGLNPGDQFGMLWFDVEQCSGCWNDVNSNAAYLQDAVNEAVSLGINLGIYSSEYEWGATVGYFDNVNSFPLWYAHYDDNPSFSDTSYYQFGGWTSPAIKQFTDQSPYGCSTSADQNWYPDDFEPWWWKNLTESRRRLGRPDPAVVKAQRAEIYKAHKEAERAKAAAAAAAAPEEPKA